MLFPDQLCVPPPEDVQLKGQDAVKPKFKFMRELLDLTIIAISGYFSKTEASQLLQCHLSWLWKSAMLNIKVGQKGYGRKNDGFPRARTREREARRAAHGDL